MNPTGTQMPKSDSRSTVSECSVISSPRQSKLSPFGRVRVWPRALTVAEPANCEPWVGHSAPATVICGCRATLRLFAPKVGVGEPIGGVDLRGVDCHTPG